MKSTRKISVLIIAFCALCISIGVQAGNRASYDPSTTEEFRMRSGLPNFFSKVNELDTVRIGFIGGSITAGGDEKWSGKVFNWVKSQYPDVVFEKYNAAVAGTPAPFGAFRMQSELLVHKPDLIFIEYRVNGLGYQGVKGPEGMVRQALHHNPNTDICFVYTISNGMIETIRNAKQTSVGKVLEETANYYGFPSIDMGIEVVKLLDEDKLVFQSQTDVEGKIVFSNDGTHPLEAGAEIYKEVVARYLLEMKDDANIIKHSLPDAIDPLSFEDASVHTIAEVEKSSNWTMMDPNTDEIYRSARWRSEFVLGQAYKTYQTNETITIKWEGYVLALTNIPQGTGMAIEVVTDGQTAKEYVFEQQGTTRYGSYMFYLPTVENGQHTTTIKVTKLPNGSSYYFGQFYTAKKMEKSSSAITDHVSKPKEISFFPNPAKEHLTVCETLNGCSYELFDCKGMPLKSGVISNNQLDVSTLPQGTYLLKTGNTIGRFLKL